MEFAERMLRKYGWDDDKGLGKDNQGMKTPIKAVLKFDNRGVRLFPNNSETFILAAKKVSESLDQSQGEEKKDQKRKHSEDKQESSKKSIYSRFEKSSVLMGNKEESLRVEQETVVTEVHVSSLPTDEELHRICGGRTAHKGARHGIRMNGKLQRLQEQEERSFSASSEILLEQNIEKKKKKKRKADETVE
ncbi:unnamed protein product [Rotaria socialis]